MPPDIFNEALKRILRQEPANVTDFTPFFASILNRPLVSARLENDVSRQID